MCLCLMCPVLSCPRQVSNQLKAKGARGWLLYDSGDGADASQQPGAAAETDDAAGGAAAERTPGLAQWLVKLVPGLSLGLLHQLGCQSLGQLLLLPGLFDSLLTVMPTDKEGIPHNM